MVLNKNIKAAYSTFNSRYGDSQNGSKELGDDYNRFIDFDVNSPIKVLDVSCKGKLMYWELSDNWFLLCTFGMTGQWSTEEGKHPCFVVEFDDGTSIYFNDPRHFGTIKITNNPQHVLDKVNELGWDPLKPGRDKYELWLKSQIKKSSKTISELLLDQKIFAGVGNYIRAEALYLSRLSPFREGRSLNDDEIKLLFDSIVNVMEESYKYQGATIQTYKTVYGAEGKYSSQFKVYGKKQDPLGNKIVSEKSREGRTIHWCPALQK